MELVCKHLRKAVIKKKIEAKDDMPRVAHFLISFTVKHRYIAPLKLS